VVVKTSSPIGFDFLKGGSIDKDILQTDKL
jgi:hypothetical protein